MKLVVLCSGNGTNFENIVTNPLCNKHEVVLMIHNKEKCGAMKRAARWGIPHIHIPHKNEDLMIRTIRAFAPDLIVLAGYMRILSPRFIGSFDNIINVHPSLLPKYKGINAVEQALESGDSETGVTVHYVTEELDSGQIVIQHRVPILPNDDVKSLTKAIQRVEYGILPQAINLCASSETVPRVAHSDLRLL
jgi:formyltetrahydrofolate-dependent phosphoribosylglycinamide formyltransferase